MGNGIKKNISDPLAGTTGDIQSTDGSKGLPLLSDKQILKMNRNGGIIKNLSSEFLPNDNYYRFIILDNVHKLSISVVQTLVRRCTLPSFKCRISSSDKLENSSLNPSN